MEVTKPSVPTSTGWQMTCTNMKSIPACGELFSFLSTTLFLFAVDEGCWVRGAAGHNPLC